MILLLEQVKQWGPGGCDAVAPMKPHHWWRSFSPSLQDVDVVHTSRFLLDGEKTGTALYSCLLQESSLCHNKAVYCCLHGHFSISRVSEGGTPVSKSTGMSPLTPLHIQ